MKGKGTFRGGCGREEEDIIFSSSCYGLAYRIQSKGCISDRSRLG